MALHADLFVRWHHIFFQELELYKQGTNVCKSCVRFCWSCRTNPECRRKNREQESSWSPGKLTGWGMQKQCLYLNARPKGLPLICHSKNKGNFFKIQLVFNLIGIRPRELDLILKIYFCVCAWSTCLPSMRTEIHFPQSYANKCSA